MEITKLMEQLEELKNNGVTNIVVYKDSTSEISEINCVSEDDTNETTAMLII